MDRFIRLINQAGKQPFLDVMSEKVLTSLQNAMVDIR
jgi:hypothetical protein